VTATFGSAVIIGFGNSGRLIHLPLLAAAGFTDVAVLPTSERARESAVAAGVRTLEGTGGSPRQRFDVAVVAVPDDAHEKALRLALKFSPLAVVVDKPVATSVAAARRMRAAAAAARALIVPFQNRRWDADVLMAADVVRSGRIGKIVRMESSWDYWAPAGGTTWRQRRREGVDGRLADLGSHLVDQLVHLLGPADCAFADVASVRDATGPNDDVFLVLRHHSGTVSHLTVSAVSHTVRPRFVLHGTNGTCRIDGRDHQFDRLIVAGQPPQRGRAPENNDLRGFIVTDAGQQELTRPPADWADFYRILKEHLRGVEAAPVEMADAIDVLSILEAAAAATR
jgi:scyllo-inositol 2-dehydrogenase (NADP+)